VLSQIAHGVFPDDDWSHPLFYVVQAMTLAILVLAANTSYQGFPRLLAQLAQDGFVAKQFRNLGDRLVHSNGILYLALLSAGLIVAFGANVDSLIHLYVVGVFTAFTLAQAGMVRYWERTREPGWRRRAVINGFGAALTGLVMVVVVATKFTEGAWAVIVGIPLLVARSYLIRRHYRRVGRRLSAGVAAVVAAPPPTNTILLYVERLDEATRYAAWYADVISGGSFHPVVCPDKKRPYDFAAQWHDLTGGSVPVTVLAIGERRSDTVLEHIWALPRGESNFVTVVIPEQFKRRSLVAELLQGTELALKVRLLREPGVAISDVTATAPQDGAESLPAPKRLVCRVLVADAHAATIRALNYASTLHIEDTHAVSFAFDEDEARRVGDDWRRHHLEAELEVVDAPYRDISFPLLRYLRALTADPETAVVVVMPELNITGPTRLLHNQAALYVKRLLLFEPHVILTSVPYQLR
jgi:hypothetical protein